MSFYKFALREYVEHIVGGSLKLSTSAWFRHLEGCQGPRIGDQFENRVSYDGRDVTITSNSPEANTLRQLRLVAVEGDSEVRIGRIDRVGTECLIFSFSQGAFDELAQQFRGRTVPAADRYDGALEIRDPVELAESLYATGTIRLDGDRHARLTDLCGQPTVGPVEYAQTDFRIGEPGVDPSPLRKPVAFAAQCEWRIVLPLLQEPRFRRHRVTVKAEIPAGLLSPIGADPGCGRAASDARPLLGEAAADVAQGVAAWWNDHPDPQPAYQQKLLQAYTPPGPLKVPPGLQAEWDQMMVRERELAAECARLFGQRVACLAIEAADLGIDDRRLRFLPDWAIRRLSRTDVDTVWSFARALGNPRFANLRCH